MIALKFQDSLFDGSPAAQRFFPLSQLPFLKGRVHDQALDARDAGTLGSALKRQARGLGHRAHPTLRQREDKSGRDLSKRSDIS